jgi:YHS domain-containing protein
MKFGITVAYVAAVLTSAAIIMAAEQRGMSGTIVQKVSGTSGKVEQKAAGEQITCPVTGEPIDKKCSTVYKGKTVYFCCPACKPLFEKNPEKYIDRLPQFRQ